MDSKAEFVIKGIHNNFACYELNFSNNLTNKKLF